MITLSEKLLHDIQEAARLAREAIASMKAADNEARQDDKRDGTAVYEEMYGDEDHAVDPRTIARNWADAQDRARQATQHLENTERSARYDVDDLMAALLELEDATKDTNPDLSRDLAWARSRTFQPGMEDELFYHDFDKRLERLIELLEDLTKPEEREAREKLIAWAQERGMTPWGKTNKQLRDGILQADYFRS